MQITTVHGRILGIIKASELKISYQDIYENDELMIRFVSNLIEQLRQLHTIPIPQWTQFKMSEIKPDVYMVEIKQSDTEQNIATIAPPYGMGPNDSEYLSIQNTSLETIIQIANKLATDYSDIITGSELRKIDEYYWLIVEISGPEKRLDKIEMELSEIDDYFDTASERDELVLEHTKVILPENAILQLNQV